MTHYSTSVIISLASSLLITLFITVNNNINSIKMSENLVDCRINWEYEYHNDDQDPCPNLRVKYNGMTGDCSDCNPVGIKVRWINNTQGNDFTLYESTTNTGSLSNFTGALIAAQPTPYNIVTYAVQTAIVTSLSSLIIDGGSEWDFEIYNSGQYDEDSQLCIEIQCLNGSPETDCVDISPSNCS